ncbi:MAG: hypothetical protein ACRD2G_06015, partial [Terriglobia bacterium]
MNCTRSRLRLTVFALGMLVILCGAAIAAGAQERMPRDEAAELANWIRANYTKYEYRIAMRDGVRLFTAVYVPKDASDSQTYPIMLTRTPYGVGPYGADN